MPLAPASVSTDARNVRRCSSASSSSSFARSSRLEGFTVTFERIDQQREQALAAQGTAPEEHAAENGHHYEYSRKRAEHDEAGARPEGERSPQDCGKHRERRARAAGHRERKLTRERSLFTLEVDGEDLETGLRDTQTLCPETECLFKYPLGGGDHGPRAARLSVAATTAHRR